MNHKAEAMVQSFLDSMNKDGRVSAEVLALYLATPSRNAVRALCHDLKQRSELKDVERIARLKPNNAVRDLTAPWRLQQKFVDTHKLLLNLETVNPEFRHKYPDPNLTLPAGGIETGESPLQAAHRELFEETRIKVDPALVRGHIGLFRNGMHMYCVVITADTPIMLCPEDKTLYVGNGRRPPPSSPPLHNLIPWRNTRISSDSSTRPTCCESNARGDPCSHPGSCRRTFRKNWRIAPPLSKVVPAHVS